MGERMKTVLVVEDDRFTRYSLREELDRTGYIIVDAALGERALEILDQHTIDIILLDLCLPDGDGLDYLVQMREKTNIPILIISGNEDQNVKIKAFELYADDFILKPYQPADLLARIHANLSRYAMLCSDAAQEQDNALGHNQAIRFGSWNINRDQYQLIDTHKQSARLTPREFRLFEVLLQKAGEVMHREELCEAIREKNYIPTPRAVDVKITRIRKKIGDDAGNPQLIKTVRGIGYMLNNEHIR
jgi:DNA-binding response OmpR family regulator